MICDYNKGKMTLGEALEYDVQFLHYMWVKTMKELKMKNDKDNKNKAMVEVLGNLTGVGSLL